MICEIKHHNHQQQQEQHRQHPSNSPNEVATNKKYFLLFPCKGKIGDNIIKPMKRKYSKITTRNCSHPNPVHRKKSSTCFKTKDNCKFDHWHVVDVLLKE